MPAASSIRMRRSLGLRLTFSRRSLLKNEIIALADAQVEQRILNVLVAAELLVQDVLASPLRKKRLAI